MKEIRCPFHPKDEMVKKEVRVNGQTVVAIYCSQCSFMVKMTQDIYNKLTSEEGRKDEEVHSDRE